MGCVYIAASLQSSRSESEVHSCIAYPRVPGLGNPLSIRAKPGHAPKMKHKFGVDQVFGLVLK